MSKNQRHVEAYTRTINLLAEMTCDEVSVMEMFATKLMGEGRAEYGPLDLSNDTRSVGDLVAEAVDEKLDAEFYLLCAKLKAEQP